jgi:transcriptional regulator with XRE-family HTH domain
MSKYNSIKINCLRLYRRKNGLSQKRAAHFMGLKTASSLSHYERGAKVPSLKNVLKLEIVLHTPAAFLFRELYGQLKKEIEVKREKLIIR